MAKIFNKQNRIASFNNYAKSVATISQWLKLFDINYPGQNDASLNIFGNSPQEIKDFQTKVLSDLKKTNLITLTLGGNDFFELIFNEFQQNKLNLDSVNEALKETKGNIKEIFNYLFKDIISEIKRRYQYLPIL